MNNLESYDDNIERTKNDDDYPDGPAQAYFPPLQQVKGADDQKVYVLPGGWHEKLIQEMENGENSTHHASTHTIPALVFMLIFLVLICCILPCCFYTCYDPEARKHLDNFCLGAKRKLKKAVGLDNFRKSNRDYYNSLVNEDDFNDRQRRDTHINKKKRRMRSKRERTVEIPITSDESVDICITTTDVDSEDDEFDGCEELDVFEKPQRERISKDIIKTQNKDCPFEPILHGNPKHQHQHHNNRNNHYPSKPPVMENKERKYHHNYDETDYSDAYPQNIYKRYDDPVEQIHSNNHDHPIVHPHNEEEKEEHLLDHIPNFLKGYYRDFQKKDNRNSLPKENYKKSVKVKEDETDQESSALDDGYYRLTNFGLGLMDNQKSHLYDKLVSQWKYKSKGNLSKEEGNNELENLGSPPPPRHSKRRDSK